MQHHELNLSLLSVPILFVGQEDEDYGSVKDILKGCSCGLPCLPNCQETVSFLRERRAGVVICDADLPDGTWRDLLRQISQLPCVPNLIVASRRADERLWAEALNMGAYDLLLVPYDADEVIRISAEAWLDWRRKHTLVAGNTLKTPDGLMDSARIRTA